MFFIIYVVPLIGLSVGPLYFSFSMHFIFAPLARVDSLIGPGVCPESVDVIKCEFTLIGGSIREVKRSFSVFFSILVISLEFCLIGPLLYPVPMLLVIFPFTLIFCTIYMDVCPGSVRLVIIPVTLVNVPIGMD